MAQFSLLSPTTNYYWTLQNAISVIMLTFHQTKQREYMQFVGKHINVIQTCVRILWLLFYRVVLVNSCIFWCCHCFYQADEILSLAWHVIQKCNNGKGIINFVTLNLYYTNNQSMYAYYITWLSVFALEIDSNITKIIKKNLTKATLFFFLVDRFLLKCLINVRQNKKWKCSFPLCWSNKIMNLHDVGKKKF